MRRLYLLWIVLMIFNFDFSGVAWATGPVSAQEMQLLDGQIADVDWVGSSIAVRWLNPLDDQFRETTFEITPDVKIVRGHDALDLSDVNRGDQITVAYKNDPDTGEQKPVRVTVLVAGAFPPNS